MEQYKALDGFIHVSNHKSHIHMEVMKNISAVNFMQTFRRYVNRRSRPEVVECHEKSKRLEVTLAEDYVQSQLKSQELLPKIFGSKQHLSNHDILWYIRVRALSYSWVLRI
ncbi:Acetyl-CoA carboxylase [Dirofilaria immitis]